MAGQLELLKAELASTCAQLERASRSLEVVREESRQKAQLVAGLQKEVRRLEDRMNVLEYRCMLNQVHAHLTQHECITLKYNYL